MADKKEKNTKAPVGPGLSLRTKPAKNTSLRDDDGDETLDETTNNPQPATTDDGLPVDPVTGGCSTCGSSQHDTVKCDSQDPPPGLTMSGALQRDVEGSAAEGTCDADKWRELNFINAQKNAQHSVENEPGQGTKRRNSA